MHTIYRDAYIRQIYTKNKRNIGRKINRIYWVANAVSVYWTKYTRNIREK